MAFKTLSRVAILAGVALMSTALCAQPRDEVGITEWERIDKLISDIYDANSPTARSSKFDDYVVPIEGFRGLAGLIEKRGLVANIDETSADERKAATIGYVLMMTPPRCYGSDTYSPAFAEYCRYFTHADPRVRAIAFAFASEVGCAWYEPIHPTLVGCRDNDPAVRSAAFLMLRRQVEYDPRDSASRNLAREFVRTALESDRGVSRVALYKCASEFGSELRFGTEDLFRAMFNETDGEAAAQALARIDERPAMIDRVAEALQNATPTFQRSAIVFITHLRYGARSKAVPVALERLLTVADDEQRARVVELILGREIDALQAPALAAAEQLIRNPASYYEYAPRLIPAVVNYGLAHPEGVTCLRNVIHTSHEDIREEVRENVRMHIEYLLRGRRSDAFREIWTPTSNSELSSQDR